MLNGPPEALQGAVVATSQAHRLLHDRTCPQSHNHETNQLAPNLSSSMKRSSSTDFDDVELLRSGFPGYTVSLENDQCELVQQPNEFDWGEQLGVV